MVMTCITRTLVSHKAIKNRVMLPQNTAREQWISRDGATKQSHDGGWREYRKTKAMSWPKSFLSSIITPGMISHTDVHDNSRDTIPEEEEIASPDSKEFSPTKQLLPSHSENGLLGECEEALMLTENSVASRLNRFNEAPLGSKFNYKRWSVDEELSTQSSSRECSNVGKSTAYRRAKGGLRDLIRLHEEEIARASGAPKVCTKKPKHEDIRQYSTLFGCEDYNVQPSSNSKLSDIEKRKDSFLEKQHGRHMLESDFIDVDRSHLPADRGAMPLQVEFVEKSTSTEFADLLSPTLLELELKKQVAEKDVLISLLSQEKENLLCKLEEQKKVANAYQKLEDRYRRRVFELEKVLFSCSCGALGSKSPSEQDLTKHMWNGKLDRHTSTSQLEIHQPSKVDSIINELETWLIDQKSRQDVHENSSDIQEIMASESSLSSLSDFRLNSFPLEFIDQVDGTSV